MRTWLGSRSYKQGVEDNLVLGPKASQGNDKKFPSLSLHYKKFIILLLGDRVWGTRRRKG